MTNACDAGKHFLHLARGPSGGGSIEHNPWSCPSLTQQNLPVSAADMAANSAAQSRAVQHSHFLQVPLTRPLLFFYGAAPFVFAFERQLLAREARV